MTLFSLNLLSFSFFVTAIFIATVFFLLWKIPDKSKASNHLTAVLFAEIFHNLGVGLKFMIQNPLGAYASAIGMAGAMWAFIHTIGFFLSIYQKDEKKWHSYLIKALYAVCSAVIIVFIVETYRKGWFYNTDGSYFDSKAREIYLFFVFLSFFLLLVYPVIAIFRSIKLKGKERIEILLFLFFFLFLSSAPAILNILRNYGELSHRAYYSICNIIFILGWFIVTVYYFNTTKEKTSLMSKITIISLAVYSLIFLIAGYTGLVERDSSYNRSHVESAKIIEFGITPLPADFIKTIPMSEEVKDSIFQNGIIMKAVQYKEHIYLFDYGQYLSFVHGISIKLFLVLMGVYLFVFLGFRFFFRGAVIVPLKNLVEATKELNFEIKVEKPGKDEIGIVGNAFNAMAEKLLESQSKLRESEKRWNFALEATGDGVWDWEIDKKRIYYSKKMLKLLNIDENSTSASVRTWFKSVFPEDRKSLYEAIRAHVKGETEDFSNEHRLLCKDETTKWVHARGKIFAGEIFLNRFIGTLSDVSSRKEAEKEIRHLQNYLSNIIESMPSMLISVNNNSIITQWNQATASIYGIPASYAVGKKIYEIIPAFIKYKDILKNTVENSEKKILRREHLTDDETRYSDISIYPLISNGVSGSVIIIDDITESEKKDAQLRQVQKMEVVGTLAGGLAHDFNNVLGGIMGVVSLIQFMLDSNNEPNIEKIRDYINLASDAVKKASSMTKQLLTLSRKQEMNFSTVDLNASITNVVEIIKNSIDKSIEIKKSLFPEPANSEADENQIEQVFLNLCINAAHAMTLMRSANEKQGGTLDISIASIYADRLFCEHHQEAKEIPYWIIKISDSGVGMDSKTIAKIFEPFFTTKEQGKGTGLGLSMVYSIVKKHDGFIDVYSELGLGSTFSLYIPAKQGAYLKGTVTESKHQIMKGTGTILVVDDDPIMRETSILMLSECGYNVFSAEDGAKAVEMFRGNMQADMVFLDISMPGLSSKEAFEQIKKIVPSTKFIITSGHRIDKRIDELLELGVLSFIQKPFSISDISAILKKIN